MGWCRRGCEMGGAILGWVIEWCILEVFVIDG